MHQGHNIPWDLLASNLKFVREDRSFTPAATGLVTQNKPNTKSELTHFVKKVVQAIRTFSETERKKYPDTFPSLYSGNLFSDELRDKYPEYLDKDNQRVEYWIQRARPPSWADPSVIEIRYDTNHGRLADVVKVLLHENEMGTLLMLAQHPSIPLGTLNYLSWGHHFGFSRVKESAVHAYLFFNAAEACGILENGKYVDIEGEYKTVLCELGTSMDYPAQQIPHRKFLQSCGVLEKVGYDMDLTKKNEVIVHGDYGRLQEYLKNLFALMYRYDLLMEECGLDPEWEKEIAYHYPLRGALEMRWDGATEKWILP